MLFLAMALSLLPLPMQNPDPPQPPNILFIVMDDMRADELWAMPNVNGRAGGGAVFTRAFAHPLCCPSRSSTLGGGYYAKNHHVINNEQPDGGAWAFAALDGDTLATRMQLAGYRTGLLGKYLNGYPAWAGVNHGAEIPPGWNTFHGTGNQPNWSDWLLWTGSTGPTARGAGVKVSHIAAYPADELTDEAVDFMAGAEPWFLDLCYLGPHSPAQPKSGDAGGFDAMRTTGRWRYRGGAWGAAVANPPAWWTAATSDWQDPAAYTASQPFRSNHVTPDDLVADRLACLAAIDQRIEDLFGYLESTGLIQRTIVIFWSDNGFQLGEHRLYDKSAGYEESIRVPLIVWGPDVPAMQCDELVAADVDVAVSVLEAAGGVQFVAADGRSLWPLLEGTAGRGMIYTQNWPADGDEVRGWALLRDAAHKLIVSDDGTPELYDLTADPFEAVNLAGQAAYAEVEAALLAELEAARGLSLRTDALPDAQVGVPYSFQLAAWGGTEPYTFAKTAGFWPAGLSMTSAGLISGTPSAVGEGMPTIRVTDSSTSPRTGTAMRVTRSFTLGVRP